jgi:hypothetical protein
VGGKATHADVDFHGTLTMHEPASDIRFCPPSALA